MVLMFLARCFMATSAAPRARASATAFAINRSPIPLPRNCLLTTMGSTLDNVFFDNESVVRSRPTTPMILELWAATQNRLGSTVSRSASFCGYSPPRVGLSYISRWYEVSSLIKARHSSMSVSLTWLRTITDEDSKEDYTLRNVSLEDKQIPGGCLC